MITYVHQGQPCKCGSRVRLESNRRCAPCFMQAQNDYKSRVKREIDGLKMLAASLLDSPNAAIAHIARIISTLYIHQLKYLNAMRVEALNALVTGTYDDHLIYQLEAAMHYKRERAA